MRIIDADKLPVIRTFALVNDKKTEGSFAFAPIYCVMKGDLDNAPTVEPICNQIAWEQGYEVGLAQGKSERPKGKWIVGSEYDCFSHIEKTYTCPFCNHKFYTKYPFCTCGAKMQNGGCNR